MFGEGFKAYASSAVDATKRRRRVVGLITLTLWIVATIAAGLSVQTDPTPLNGLCLALLLALFVVVHLQATLMAWSASRDSSRMLALVYSARYLSEVKGLPARDTFLAELGREMRTSRADGRPCTLVVTRLAELEKIRNGFGDHFAHKAVEQLGARLARITRRGDLLGYVGDGAFATLLVDCSSDQGQQFLRRIPVALAIDAHPERTRSLAIQVCSREYDGLVEDPVDFLDQAWRSDSPERFSAQPSAAA